MTRSSITTYYSHFEIAEFSQYQYYLTWKQKGFQSHFVPETEMMQYRVKMV